MKFRQCYFLYSKKIKGLDELKKGDIVSVPNDPTNGARALRLLEQNGLITLKPGEFSKIIGFAAGMAGKK